MAASKNRDKSQPGNGEASKIEAGYVPPFGGRTLA